MKNLLRALPSQLPALLIGALLALAATVSVYAVTHTPSVPLSDYRASVSHAYESLVPKTERAVCVGRAEGIARGLGAQTAGVGNLSTVGVEIADFGTPPKFEPTDSPLRCQIIIVAGVEDFLNEGWSMQEPMQATTGNGLGGYFAVYPPELPDQMYVVYQFGVVR